MKIILPNEETDRPIVIPKVLAEESELDPEERADRMSKALLLMAQGIPSREVADEVGLELQTVKDLRTGKVAGIDLTTEQLDALKDQGFAGLYNARERYLDALEILDVTATQLNAWEVTNPQPAPCFGRSGVGCPTPTP